MESASPAKHPSDLLRRFYRMLGKRRRFIIFATVLLILLGGFGTYYATPRYQATATIYIQAESVRPNLFSDVTPGAGAGWPSVEVIIATIAEVAQSRSMAEELVREFQLDRPRPPRSVRDRLHLIQDAVVQGCLKLLDKVGILTYHPPDLFRRAVNELQGCINAEADKNTELLSITVANERPKQAQLMCNYLVDALIGRTAQYGLGEVARLYGSTQGELPALQVRLDAAEARLEGYKRASQVLDIRNEMQIHAERLDATRAELETARRQEQEIGRELAAAEQQLRSKGQYAVSSQVIDNSPAVRVLTDELRQLERNLARAQASYTDKHPEVLAIKRQIAEAQSQLEREARRVLTAETTSLDPVYQMLAEKTATLFTDLQGAQAREEGLGETVRLLEGRISELTGKEKRLASLQRERDMAENAYVQLSAKTHELDVLRRSGGPPLSISVVDAARLPGLSDLTPPYLVLAFLIPFCGLVLALTMALVAEYFDSSFQDEADVEEWLARPCLAKVPRLSRRQAAKLGGRGDISDALETG